MKPTASCELDVGEATQCVVALEIDDALIRVDAVNTKGCEELGQKTGAARQAPSQSEGHVVLISTEQVEDGCDRNPPGAGFRSWLTGYEEASRLGDLRERAGSYLARPPSTRSARASWTNSLALSRCIRRWDRHPARTASPEVDGLRTTTPGRDHCPVAVV